jgi:hypothetical protein
LAHLVDEDPKGLDDFVRGFVVEDVVGALGGKGEDVLEPPGQQ